jgi:hypothetical protein
MKRCLDCYTLPPLMDVLKAMIMDSHEKMVISCLVVDAGNLKSLLCMHTNGLDKHIL